MNNEEKILSILESIAVEVSSLKKDVGGLKEDVGTLKEDVDFVRGSVVRIEQDHGKKLDALFDGYQQLHEKVATIEEHVTAQDEVILKRVFPKAAD